jgi:Heat shock protein 9/12
MGKLYHTTAHISIDMADAGRKGFGQKLEETVTPQSQKTYAQQGE